jgi:hypothetical protein
VIQAETLCSSSSLSPSSSSLTSIGKHAKRPPSLYSVTCPDPVWTPVSQKAWRRLNDVEKLTAHIRTAEAHGGLAFTCQLSDARHAAMLVSANPTDTITANLRREFVTEDLHELPFVMVWDWSPTTGKLHLHGVVVVPEGVNPDRIRRAFAKACGRWTGKSAARQWDAEPVYDPERWAGYALKTRSPRARARTRELLAGARLIYVSRPLTQLTTGNALAARGYASTAPVATLPPSEPVPAHPSPRRARSSSGRLYAVRSCSTRVLKPPRCLLQGAARLVRDVSFGGCGLEELTQRADPAGDHPGHRPSR